MSQGPQREGGTRQDTVRVTERKRLSEGHSRIGEKKKVEKSNLQTDWEFRMCHTLVSYLVLLES